MGKAIGWALVLGVFVLCPGVVLAQAPAGGPDPIKLIQGCLAPPSADATAQIASAVGATPYSDLRRKNELTANTTHSAGSSTGEDYQVKATVTEFEGWDLPATGGGTLTYQEVKAEAGPVDRTTQLPTKPVRTTLDRSCSFKAPVVNARAFFELFEGVADQPYGIRVSADGRWVNMFRFDPDNFDIELNLGLEAPLTGVASDGDQMKRLIVPDGGPGYIDHDASSIPSGVPSMTLTRAALLTALDQPGVIAFQHMEIQPVSPTTASAQGASPN